MCADVRARRVRLVALDANGRRTPGRRDRRQRQPKPRRGRVHAGGRRRLELRAGQSRNARLHRLDVSADVHRRALGVQRRRAARLVRRLLVSRRPYAVARARCALLVQRAGRLDLRLPLRTRAALRGVVGILHAHSVRCRRRVRLLLMPPVRALCEQRAELRLRGGRFGKLRLGRERRHCRDISGRVRVRSEPRSSRPLATRPRLTHSVRRRLWAPDGRARQMATHAIMLAFTRGPAPARPTDKQTTPRPPRSRP